MCQTGYRTALAPFAAANNAVTADGRFGARIGAPALLLTGSGPYKASLPLRRFSRLGPHMEQTQ